MNTTQQSPASTAAGQTPVRPAALVTGSSRGIGRATAVTLAQRGYDVAVHYRRDADGAKGTVAAVEAAGGQAVALQAELQDEDAVRRLVAETYEVFGRIDTLVANAASTVFKPLRELEPRHLDLTFRTIVQSFLLLTQGVVEVMDDQSQGGAIVAVSGIDAARVMEHHGLLAAAKGALEQLVRYLTVELGPRIAVNAVVPGFVDTESSRFWADTSYPGGAKQIQREVPVRTPAGRMAQPEDIAEIIAFLCSPSGRWIRGQVVVADGGLTVRL